MIMFGKPQPERAEDQWKYQLARFAKEYKLELAALSCNDNGTALGLLFGF